MIGEFIQRHPTFGDFIEALRLRYRAWKQGLPEIPHDGDSQQARYASRLCKCPVCGLTQMVSTYKLYGMRKCADQECKGTVSAVFNRCDSPSKYWTSPEDAAEFYRQRCERMANE
jgi:hypothetical protein